MSRPVLREGTCENCGKPFRHVAVKPRRYCTPCWYSAPQRKAAL